MASALASGFVNAGLSSGENMIASDVSGESREAFAKSTGARVSGFNPDVAKAAALKNKRELLGHEDGGDEQRAKEGHAVAHKVPAIEAEAAADLGLPDILALLL